MGQLSCSHCNEPLPDRHVGECPKCGKKGRTIALGTAIERDVALPISWMSVKEFYEKNNKAHAAVIFITILSPFIGLFLAGWLGVFVGGITGAIAYFLGPKAVIKVREIKHGP